MGPQNAGSVTILSSTNPGMDLAKGVSGRRVDQKAGLESMFDKHLSHISASTSLQKPETPAHVDAPDTKKAQPLAEKSAMAKSAKGSPVVNEKLSKDEPKDVQSKDDDSLQSDQAPLAKADDEVDTTEKASKDASPVVDEDESASEAPTPLVLLPMNVAEPLAVKKDLSEESVTSAHSSDVDLQGWKKDLLAQPGISALAQKEESGKSQEETVLTDTKPQMIANPLMTFKVANDSVNQTGEVDRKSTAPKSATGAKSSATDLRSEIQDLLKSVQTVLKSSPKEGFQSELSGQMNDLLKTPNESASAQPVTSFKSLVDSLWVQNQLQSGSPSASALNDSAQVATLDSRISPDRVTSSLVDDLRPLLNRVMTHRQGGDMTLSLRPDNLGFVKVDVHVLDNDVRVSIQAEQPHAKQLLESQSGELKTQLVAAGLKVESLSVSQSSSASEHSRSGEQFNDRKDPSSQNPQHERESRRDSSHRGGEFEMPVIENDEGRLVA